MREEATQIANELLKQYNLLSVKASMVIFELIKENDRLIEQLKEYENATTTK